MAKVVTSQGIQDFVQSGKFDTVKNDAPKKREDAPPLEVKDKPLVADASDAGDKKEAKTPADTAPDEDTAVDDDTRAAIEADQVCEAHERELAEWKAKAAPAATETEGPKKPDPQKFYDDKGQFKAFEYAEELAAYSAAKAVADDRARVADDQRKAELAIAESDARKRVAEAIKVHPDFEEVMAATDLRTHNMVLQYLSASEHIGEVTYYLAKHPDFVERINALHPLKALAQVRDLEKTFEKPAADPDKKSEPAPLKTSGAPAPIKPLSSATTVNTNTDPSKMTYRELRAYERSRARNRR